MCYPSRGHLPEARHGEQAGGEIGGKFLRSPLLVLQSQRSHARCGAAAVGPYVPEALSGAQGRPLAQQGSPQRFLQEHRLAQQHQLHLPLCAQAVNEPVSCAHAAGLHHVLLALCILDAATVREVKNTCTGR